jgi:hypothetical protein
MSRQTLLLLPRWQSVGVPAAAAAAAATATAASTRRRPSHHLIARVARAAADWSRPGASRALSTLTHPRTTSKAKVAAAPLTLLAPRSHNPAKTATGAKAFATLARSSTLHHPPSRHPSDHLPRQPSPPTHRRARPPPLLSPVRSRLCSSRRLSTTPTMAEKWTGLKVRQTFFDFFSERGHTIGM